MRYPERARLSILLASALMVALGVAFVWLQLATPSDGARLDPGQPAWRPDGVVVTPLREQPGGLRAGDIVVAVDGVSMESWAQALLDPTMTRPHWHFGQTVTYSVLRDGTPLDVPVTLGSYPLDAIWQEDWSTIVFALVFALIALYIVLRRPTENWRRWCCCSLRRASSVGRRGRLALQVSDLVGGVGFWLYTVTTGIVYLLFYIAALHFALIFPRSHPFLARRAGSLGDLCRTLCTSAWPGWRRCALGRPPPSSGWEAGARARARLSSCYLWRLVAAVVWGYRVHRDAETRTKVRWMVFGALLSGIAGLLLWDIPAAVLGHSADQRQRAGVAHPPVSRSPSPSRFCATASSTSTPSSTARWSMAA